MQAWDGSSSIKTERLSLRHVTIDLENLRIFSDNQTFIRAINSELLDTNIFVIIANINTSPPRSHLSLSPSCRVLIIWKPTSVEVASR
ncbi:hypothetical protein DY000_02043600 [Brassica cretica]|uniref:STAS domain-containing protein n=1 Tax=Brassica cretica TaxID=69181 RepID=A0ABQ7B9U1_BRACR|nr:hypothetical protein DY000_02043600 [Brassica cretica]